jgi:uncharacterized protein YpiB (UPF0302 family)
MFYQHLRSGRVKTQVIQQYKPASPQQALTFSEPHAMVYADMNFVEQLIFKEVAVIMTQNSVTDRGYLYNKVTQSLWDGESSLQVYNYITVTILTPLLELV